MDKKRLKELKAMMSISYKDRHDIPQLYFTVNELKWLIEQAEQAEKVEMLDKRLLESFKLNEHLNGINEEQERILKQQDKIINGLSDINLMFFSKIVDYEKALLAYGDSKGKLILKDLEEVEKFLKNQEVKGRLVPKYTEHTLSTIHWDED
jgi:hypothetical protein